MTEGIRKAINQIATTNRAQHDRIRTVLTLICNEIDKLKNPVVKVAKRETKEQTEVKGDTPTIEKLMQNIKEKKSE